MQAEIQVVDGDSLLILDIISIFEALSFIANSQLIMELDLFNKWVKIFIMADFRVFIKIIISSIIKIIMLMPLMEKGEIVDKHFNHMY